MEIIITNLQIQNTTLYWHSKWSVPIAKVAKRLPTSAQAREKRRWLDDRVAAYKPNFPYPIDRTPAEIYARIEEVRDRLVWANAEVVYDDPAKKVGNRDHQAIAVRLGEVVAQTRDEILLEAAYYIPRDRGIQRLRSVRDRGVRVRGLPTLPQGFVGKRSRTVRAQAGPGNAKSLLVAGR